MGIFRQTLRSRIERVQEAVVEARQAGHDYEAQLYGARLHDLLDLAARNDVDTSEWVDHTLMEFVTYQG